MDNIRRHVPHRPQTHLKQQLDPHCPGPDHVARGVARQPAQVVQIISFGKEPGALVKGVDGVKDLLLAEVVDDVSVVVPDLEEAELRAPLVQGGHQITVDVPRKVVQIV